MEVLGGFSPSSRAPESPATLLLWVAVTGARSCSPGGDDVSFGDSEVHFWKPEKSSLRREALTKTPLSSSEHKPSSHMSTSESSSLLSFDVIFSFSDNFPGQTLWFCGRFMRKMLISGEDAAEVRKFSLSASRRMFLEESTAHLSKVESCLTRGFCLPDRSGIVDPAPLSRTAKWNNPPKFLNGCQISSGAAGACVNQSEEPEQKWSNERRSLMVTASSNRKLTFFFQNKTKYRRVFLLHTLSIF